MNYKKALEDILELVDNDFCAEMEVTKDYTQDEAREMADIIKQVYSIAHCLYCETCRKNKNY